MYIIRNIKIPYDLDNYENLKKTIEEKVNKKIDFFKIYKKSIDARRGIFYVYQVLVDCDIDKKTRKKLKNDIGEFIEEDLHLENRNKIIPL